MRIATTARQMPTWLTDVLSGLLVLGAGWAGLWIAHLTPWYPMNESAIERAILATAIVTATRRVAPRTTFWVTVIGFPYYYDAPVDLLITVLPIGIAGYGVTRAGRMRMPLALAIGAVSTAIMALREPGYTAWLFYWNPGLLKHLGVIADYIRFGGPINYSDLALCLAIALFPTFLGWAMRRMDLQRLELDARRRSLERQNAELDRLRLVEAQEAVGAERTRIARELHDVIAHHVSAIVVRSAASARVSKEDPSALEETLEWVADTGRKALDDMREVVRVLRTNENTSYAPAADAAGVDAAVETARAAGLGVRFEREGELPELSPAGASALVRVSQEALTNVLLHSRARHVSVRVAATPEGVHLTVWDPGPPEPDTRAGEERAGNGLRNMAERAAACSGTFSAGPASSGWEVRTWIPALSRS